MASNYNHVEHYRRADNKWAWRIKVGANVVATDGGQGYENEIDCLASLFGIWFGTWDESFLSLYEQWQSGGGATYELPPEAQEGAPVHVATEHAEITAAAAKSYWVANDLGNDPDGDCDIDPRDT